MDAADTSGDFRVLENDTLNEVMQRLLPELNLSGRVEQLERFAKASGGNCDIYYGRILETGGIFVAIRRPRFSVFGKDPHYVKRTARELYVWSKLKHQNVLPLSGFLDEGNIYPSLITPWMPNGTARQYLQRNENIPLLPLVKGIAAGLLYLHDKNIVHADLKAENILISDDGTPLLSDFGLTRFLDPSSTLTIGLTSANTKGTLRWMAIEQLNSEEALYTKETDVWSFAMTIYELLTKGLPYAEIRVEAQVSLAIINGQTPGAPALLEARDSVDQQLWKICKSCWHKDPSRRPTITHILSFVEALSMHYPITWMSPMRRLPSSSRPSALSDNPGGQDYLQPPSMPNEHAYGRQTLSDGLRMAVPARDGFRYPLRPALEDGRELFANWGDPDSIARSKENVDYWTTELKENPLGLTGMIPLDETFYENTPLGKPSEEGGQNFVWVPALRADASPVGRSRRLRRYPSSSQAIVDSSSPYIAPLDEAPASAAPDRESREKDALRQKFQVRADAPVLERVSRWRSYEYVEHNGTSGPGLASIPIDKADQYKSSSRSNAPNPMHLGPSGTIEQANRAHDTRRYEPSQPVTNRAVERSHIVPYYSDYGEVYGQAQIRPSSPLHQPAMSKMHQATSGSQATASAGFGSTAVRGHGLSGPSASFKPQTRHVRMGYWNRRGDHLTDDGYVVYCPPERNYPKDLGDYPDNAFKNHNGQVIHRLPSAYAEMPDSIPLQNGRIPKRSYDSFIGYKMIDG